MNIQTISLVTPPGCDGHCPYCVSRMTGMGCPGKLDLMQPGSHDAVARKRWNMKLAKALTFAKLHGATTAIVTGKGEPMLFPSWIDAFMDHLNYTDHLSYTEPPFVELQTNALRLGKELDDLGERPIWKNLKDWYSRGATHVAISVVSLDRDENRQIYDPKGQYIALRHVIDKLHVVGYTVRLNCIMVRGYTDRAERVRDFITVAKAYQVDQLSFRPVNCPDESRNAKVYKWTKDRTILPDDLDAIKAMIDRYGTRLLRLPHGAVVYDVDGQNVCLTDCLSTDEAPDNLRQVIFLPDGRVTYSWQHEGAILLR